MPKLPSPQTQLRTLRRDLERARQEGVQVRQLLGFIDAELRRVDHLIPGRGHGVIRDRSTLHDVRQLVLRVAELSGSVAAYERVFQAIGVPTPVEE